MQNIKPVQKCAKYEMKPVQYEQVSYFANFSRLFLLFRDKRILSFFFFWGGGGGAVEVILESFICEIESFHIIYFYFHSSITQKLNLSQ